MRHPATNKCSLGGASIPVRSNTQRLKISESVVLIKFYKLSSLLDETLKTYVPCTGSYPQACKRSQTVFRKSRGLPRLYWTSQFFSRGKHLMADELCAIHVKYIKFKKKQT